MSLPRVLIVNQPFNNDSGGGITTTNLFKGWDKDKLAVASGSHLLEYNIDTSICDNYYQLGYDEFYMAFPFNLFQRKYRSGKIQFSKERMQNLSVKKSKTRIAFIMKCVFPVLKYLGVYNRLHRTKLSGKFCEWIQEFKPDIIYTQPFSRAEVLFCIKLHEYLNKPLVFHMMDDWPSIISNRGLFKKYWSRKVDSDLRHLFDRTSLFISISDYMAKEYKKRYNRDFITFHNPVDIAFWKKSQKSDYTLKEPPTVLYAGRIGLSIETSLQVIAEAVHEINIESGLGLKFVLCTQNNPLWTKNYKCVEHRGFFSHDQMPSVLAGSDLLILPYDFSEESIKYIKYSMPTKATEYMISGTPIIVFAPEDTAIVHYAKENACAKIVTENSLDILVKALKELIADERARTEISRKAAQTAEVFHDGDYVRENFRNALASLVSQS